MSPENTEGKGKHSLSASFVTGAIALAFLIIGYQTALFIHRAAALKLLADSSAPDTVYISGTSPGRGAQSEAAPGDTRRPGQQTSGKPGALTESVGRPGRAVTAATAGNSCAGDRNARTEKLQSDMKSAKAEIREAFTPRKYESFRFDPNTVSVNDLCRLGFTLKQAESIDNYRSRGGKFRRKSDFAKSYVVQDSVYKRLEPYIDIPLLDLNAADSAAFDSLPGIGGYFASKMVEYRERLGGYSCMEQLMEIYRFDRERFDRISDLMEIRTPPTPFRLWILPADSLKMHPDIRLWSIAKAIVLYRDNNPRTLWTVEGLRNAGIIDDETAVRLSCCVIAEP